MPILLEPSKAYITIDLYLVEEPQIHGNSIFHIMDSAEDMEKWHKKGYKTLEEWQAELPLGKQSDLSDLNIITKLSCTFKIPNWKDQNELYAESLKVTYTDQGAQTNIDELKYRDLRLRKLLKKWDLKDENGAVVPITNETIDKLVPEIALELIKAFDEVVEPK